MFCSSNKVERLGRCMFDREPVDTASVPAENNGVEISPRTRPHLWAFNGTINTDAMGGNRAQTKLFIDAAEASWRAENEPMGRSMVTILVTMGHKPLRVMATK